MTDVVEIILAPQAVVEILVATETATEVQVPGLQGPKGDPGERGAPGAGYIHTQSVAATVWTVNHDLGIRPSVATFSLGGVEIIGAVQHLSINTLTITFNTAIAGTARIV